MTSDSRSPEEIERDIKHKRAGLTDTLDELQDRFSPEHMAREVADRFSKHGGDIGRSFSRAIKQNPLALTLTGVGLAWLMMSDRDEARDERVGHDSNHLHHDRGFLHDGSDGASAVRADAWRSSQDTADWRVICQTHITI